MKIILPIIFVGLGALLVWLVWGNKQQPQTPPVSTPQPTDVPTQEQANQVPPWILLSNAVVNYTK